MSGWVQTPDGRNIDLIWDDERGWHTKEDPAMGFRPDPMAEYWNQREAERAARSERDTVSQTFTVVEQNPVAIIVQVGGVEISLTLTDPGNNQRPALEVSVYSRDGDAHHGVMYLTPDEVEG